MTENEIPKYRKKRNSSTSASKSKSSHRHEYSPCLLMEKGKPHLAEFCGICGKINNVHFGEVKMRGGKTMLLWDEEVLEMYKDLPKFEVESIWEKYLPGFGKEGNA